MTDTDSFEQLVEQASRGDRAATAQILLACRDKLLSRLRVRLRLNPFADFSAEDVLQEVFVDVFRGIGTFDIERGVPFAAWLNRLADNRLASFIRDRSRLKRGGRVWRAVAPNDSGMRLLSDLGDPHASTPSERLAMKEAKQQIEVCVAALSNDQRETIERFYLQQQSVEQIAEAMNTSKDAVRSLIYRARKMLRSLMGSSSRWLRKQ